MKSLKLNPVKPRRTGLTLMEVTISTMLVGMLLVASLRLAGGALRTWYAVQTQYDRTLLANQLLDEILQASYQDPEGNVKFGEESDETLSPYNRLSRDDTDDYDDWTDSPPRYKDGSIIPGFTGWTRSVKIRRLVSSDYRTEITHHSSDEGLRLIEVTVTDSQGNQTISSAFRTSAGNPRLSKGVDTNLVTWMGCELQIGQSGEKVTAGSSVLNYAEGTSL